MLFLVGSLVVSIFMIGICYIYKASYPFHKQISFARQKANTVRDTNGGDPKNNNSYLALHEGYLADSGQHNCSRHFLQAAQ